MRPELWAKNLKTSDFLGFHQVPRSGRLMDSLQGPQVLEVRLVFIFCVQKRRPKLEQPSFWPDSPSRPWTASGLRLLYHNTYIYHSVGLPYTSDQPVVEAAVYTTHNKHKYVKMQALSGFRTRGPKKLSGFRNTNQFARPSAAALVLTPPYYILIFRNRRYRALASIIPDHERFCWNLSF